jgi:hypothetical protein
VVVTGNLFENNWVDAQAGTAIVFTPRNQDGTAPWGVVEDVTFAGNVVRNTPHCFSVLGYDNEKPSGQAKNITVRNNLCQTAGGRFATIMNEAGDLTFDHNTVWQPQPAESVVIGFYKEETIPLVGGGSRIPQYAVSGTLTVTNSIMPENAYGVASADFPRGTQTLANLTKAYVWKQNVVAGASSASYPAGTLVPSAATYAAMFDPATYLLKLGSPYATAATDGTALGWSGTSVVVTPPPPPPPPPPTSITVGVTGTAAMCTLTVVSAPPDDTLGWKVQFKKDGVNFQSAKTIAPWTRSAKVPVATYALTAVWTKTGQPAQTSAVTNWTCK